MSNHERNREDSADAAHAVPPALSIEEEALLLRQCRLNKVRFSGPPPPHAGAGLRRVIVHDPLHGHGAGGSGPGKA